jgi:type IV pilus assembly protein PilP
MKRRNAITGVACLCLMLFLVGALDARVPSMRRVAPAPSRAAQVKTSSPVAPAIGAAAGAFAAASALHALEPATPPAAAAPASPTATAPPAVAGAPATPVRAAAPAAPSPYSYNPAGKTDPFLPFVEIDLAAKKEKERKAREEALKRRAALSKRPISPLQQAEIGQFRLVGIAGDDRTRVAIVEDGVAKKFFPLFVGTYIGPNGGRVVSILPDRLIVEEPSEETSNRGKRVQTRRITVMLHKEEEGKP